VTQITDALNGLTEFTYDENGNLLTISDSRGQVTSHMYDEMGRLETRTDPLNRTETYVYDSSGNLTQFTDRKGQVSQFTYDALNHGILSSFVDGTVSTFMYDSVGRLTRAVDTASGAIEFVYDELDRLAQEVTAQGVVEYTYDAIGRRIGMIANGQTPITYQYNADSSLIEVAKGNQTVGLEYDAAGRRTSLSYSNGVTTSYSYDIASRLTNILHQGPSALIESLAYTYDAAGNRISFDRAGSPATLLPEAVQAAYDAANEQVQFNSATPNLIYDANGNLTSQTDASGTTTYTWDTRNRLMAISGPGVSASFIYDALGRRISKTINGVTTQYQYDGIDIIAEIGGGAVEATYLRNLSIDEPFVREAESSEFYHTDTLGSTLALSDQTATVQTSYHYDPFGNTVVTGVNTIPLRYTGREDDGTGLYYYRGRYYSTRLQRFISEDPLKFGGGDINLYVYVNNNPVNYIDPFGAVKEKKSLTVHTKTGVITTKSPIGEIEVALKDAKESGASKKHIKNLKTIHKVATKSQANVAKSLGRTVRKTSTKSVAGFVFIGLFDDLTLFLEAQACGRTVEEQFQKNVEDLGNPEFLSVGGVVIPNPYFAPGDLL
jgi:RHS repeat-associated protein